MANAFAAAAARVVSTADGKSDSRRKMMQAVRAACRRLGLDDDARREVQKGVIGKASMADMTLAELGRLLDRLNRDWKGPSGHRVHIGKIRALWWTLYWLGAVEEPKDRAIDAFVRRQTGVSALRFLDHRSAPAVIEALKAWAAREGVEWLPAGTADDDRRSALAAIWRRLPGGFTGMKGCEAHLADALKIGPDSTRWTAHELDAAIRHLGKALRRARSKAVVR